MIVTGIEEQTKTKFKVYLDGTFAFVLYKDELKRFGIKQGEDLAQENYGSRSERFRWKLICSCENSAVIYR